MALLDFVWDYPGKPAPETITITIILLINATNVRNKSRATQKWKDTKYQIKKIQ